MALSLSQQKGNRDKKEHNQMSTVRLCYGQDTDEMVNRIREYQFSDSKEPISALEIRETVLDDRVSGVIADLLQARRVKTVLLDDCGAYLNQQVVRMARAMGSVENIRLSEPTFLVREFLECLLSSATKLTNLRIQCRFDRRQVESLAKGLKENKSVKILDLSRSRLDSFFPLAHGLEDNTSVTELRLRSLGLNDENIGVLLEALRGRSTLTVLDLSFNHCRSMEAVAALVSDPGCRLHELVLGFQNMWQSSQIEFAALARALRKNKSITKLSLRRNKLKDSDLLLLTTALTCNYTLQQLDLRENLISSEGIRALAAVLMNGASIRRINVSKNPFDEVGSLALLNAARNNHALIQVEVGRGCPQSHEIRFETALNHGGRGLLVMNTPLALWPWVLQRINNLDFQNEESFVDEDDGRSLKFDVLHHMLRSPALFETYASSYH